MNSIPQVTDPTQWLTITTGAWCYYNNDPANADTYGLLYNWYAVNDPRHLAPWGWHIPSAAEWAILSTCLGGNTVAGGKMKETGTIHWQTPNVNATNSSGFSGLPSGFRYPDGVFSDNGKTTFWHSSTQHNIGSSENCNLAWYSGRLFMDYSNWSDGFHVRCVQ